MCLFPLRQILARLMDFMSAAGRHPRILLSPMKRYTNTSCRFTCVLKWSQVGPLNNTNRCISAPQFQRSYNIVSHKPVFINRDPLHQPTINNIYTIHSTLFARSACLCRSLPVNYFGHVLPPRCTRIPTGTQQNPAGVGHHYYAHPVELYIAHSRRSPVKYAQLTFFGTHNVPETRNN
ncbi:hypothetical protein BDZ97DRAFT_660229 [Flammula alnicola]|nr:hypothetical protein BDZ97DRAFT_660229 [Flammula alnicola]